MNGMFIFSSDDTQRFHRCELCGKFEPEALTTGKWWEFHHVDDGHKLYACDQCFDPHSKESYQRMGRVVTAPLAPLPPLSLEELFPDMDER